MAVRLPSASPISMCTAPVSMLPVPPTENVAPDASVTVKSLPALRTERGGVSSLLSNRSSSPALMMTSHFPSLQARRFRPLVTVSGAGGSLGDGSLGDGLAVVGEGFALLAG